MCVSEREVLSLYQKKTCSYSCWHCGIDESRIVRLRRGEGGRRKQARQINSLAVRWSSTAELTESQAFLDRHSIFSRKRRQDEREEATQEKNNQLLFFTPLTHLASSTTILQ